MKTIEGLTCVINPIVEDYTLHMNMTTFAVLKKHYPELSVNIKNSKSPCSFYSQCEFGYSKSCENFETRKCCKKNGF